MPYPTFIALLALLILLHPTTTNSTPAPRSSLPSLCNGFRKLCNKRYNETLFAVTHNAFAVAPINEAQSPNVLNSAVNQNPGYEIRYQLEDGYRGFKVAVWRNDQGQVHLCHGGCNNPLLFFDGGSFLGFLVQIRKFMTANTNEVLTLFVENVAQLRTKEMSGQFGAAGLLDYVWTPTLDEKQNVIWPTLSDMIVEGRRLVVFVSSAMDRSVPWLLHDTDYVAENNYRNYAPTPAHFDCEAYRPRKIRRPLTLLNHHLHILISPGYNVLQDDIYRPDYQSRLTTNSLESIAAHVRTCTRKKIKVNFLSVDWGASGNVMAAVDAYNGVVRPQMQGKRGYDVAIAKYSEVNTTQKAGQVMNNILVREGKIKIGFRYAGYAVWFGLYLGINLYLPFAQWW